MAKISFLEVLRAAAEPGYNYFNDSTMRYWGTKIVGMVQRPHGIYFATRNKRNSDPVEGFGVHYLARGGRVTTIGTYNQYISQPRALVAMFEYFQAQWRPEEITI